MCIFMFQRRLNGFPRLWTQISALKDCFKCLWKSPETKNACQDVSVMFFCPVEYAFAIKKQCSKSSLATWNTTSSEVRHYCSTITIYTGSIAYILNNSIYLLNYFIIYVQFSVEELKVTFVSAAPFLLHSKIVFKKSSKSPFVVRFLER